MQNNNDLIPEIAGTAIDVEQSSAVPWGGTNLENAKAACAIALHMHQPMIPAGEGGSLESAQIISNLDFMLHQGSDGDRYNAEIYRQCYQRLGDMIPDLVSRGHKPRVMLDYSGELLHGFTMMQAEDVLGKLKLITHEYRDCVEWLGTCWGHAVAPSTPPEDFRLHVKAWRTHFASLFGVEALSRVTGFSPPEMAIPNDPDVAYEFVKTLNDNGYNWVMVQEHTVEELETGSSPRNPHVPHLLECRNSKGESASIIAIIKTQGSDTKLVAQMQPWYEAGSLSKTQFAGKEIAPIVSQIADGENGGVMMNEFPPKFVEVVEQATGQEVELCTVGAYLQYLDSLSISTTDFPKVQPLLQGRIWEKCQPGDGPEKVQKVIKELSEADHQFHVEGGSWTSNISWVKGYEGVLNPMAEVSALFHKKIREKGVAETHPDYKRALYYLMLSQTSCYRYWGQGTWTDYGQEICRRAKEVLNSM